MRQTIAEALKEEGKKEGKKQGKLELGRKVLLRQLRKRFGEVPPEVEAGVKKATDLKQLEEWLDRVVTAKELGDVGILPVR
jgi:hypothetical protein